MYLKRKLREDLIIFKGLRFPLKLNPIGSHRYKSVVGIGGNIGDVRRRFEHLFYEIKKDTRVQLLQTSLILKNPPFGFKEQEDFFNSIIVIKTSMPPHAFLNYLLEITELLYPIHQELFLI